MTPGVLELLGHVRPVWHADAACREHPSSVFFGRRGDYEAVAEARKICARCLVSAECLSWALEEGSGLHGTRAGTTQRQRAAMRRGMVVSAVEPVGDAEA